MKINRVIKLGFAVAAAAAFAVNLTGCSALNVGEEEFSCSGMPGSVYCHSARDVYEKTNDGTVPTPVSRADGAYNPDCDDCIRAEDVNPALRVEEDGNSQYAVTPSGERLRIVDGYVRTTVDENGNRVSVAKTDDEIINNYVSPALPDSPVPIRTPAQVMRIWIAPFVDTTGDLIAPGFVYTEVEERRWIYPDEKSMPGAGRMFNPLKAGTDLTAGGRYKSPNAYSNPTKSNQDVKTDKPTYNSLLKFRRDREATFRQMRN